MLYQFPTMPCGNGLFKEAAPKSLYYIDFGSCRIFSSGPRTGVVIHDWVTAGGHVEPPEGEDNIDPFAYDIYSLGDTIYSILRVGIVLSRAL